MVMPRGQTPQNKKMHSVDAPRAANQNPEVRIRRQLINPQINRGTPKMPANDTRNISKIAQRTSCGEWARQRFSKNDQLKTVSRIVTHRSSRMLSSGRWVKACQATEVSVLARVGSVMT